MNVSITMNRMSLLHELEHWPLKRHSDNPVTPQDDPSQFKKKIPELLFTSSTIHEIE